MGGSYHIQGFIGEVGSGKTLALMQAALKEANRRKYGITANFDINVNEVYKYGEKFKKDNLKRICDDGRILCYPNDSQRDILFRYPQSIVLIDELGTKMKSRDWQKNTFNGRVLDFMAMCRHTRNLVFWTAQFADQADKYVRELTQWVGWCNGFSVPDIKRDIDVLIWRETKFYKARDFWFVEEDKKTQMKPARKFLKQKDSWWGPLLPKHYQILKCYDSFGSVESKFDRPVQAIKTDYRCNLRKDYYYRLFFKKHLGNGKEITYKDPFTRYEYVFEEHDRNVTEIKLPKIEKLEKDFKFLAEIPINYEELQTTKGGKISRINSKVTEFMR